MTRDLKVLHRQHDEMRNHILNRVGLIPAHDDEARKILREAFLLIASKLPDVVMTSDIVYLTMYNQYKQTCGAEEADGVCYYLRDHEGRLLFGIALAVQTLQYWPEYFLEVLIHEVAHTRVIDGTIGHDDNFEVYLNELLDRFNRETGLYLYNDYAGYMET